MMRTVGEMAIVMSSSLALSLVVKATVVSAGALTRRRLARRSRASVRHLLLATGFLLLLALPVRIVAVPPREVSVRSGRQVSAGPSPLRRSRIPSSRPGRAADSSAVAAPPRPARACRRRDCCWWSG